MFRFILRTRCPGAHIVLASLRVIYSLFSRPLTSNKNDRQKPVIFICAWRVEKTWDIFSKTSTGYPTGLLFNNQTLCVEEDSNLHRLPYWFLRPARLPFRHPRTIFTCIKQSLRDQIKSETNHFLFHRPARLPFRHPRMPAEYSRNAYFLLDKMERCAILV
jgi:hypothetical protein